MGIRITRPAESRPLDPPGHRGAGPVWLQGAGTDSESGLMAVVSRCPPGGEAEMAAQPEETVDLCLTDELTRVGEGRQGTFRAFDPVHFTVGTVRQVVERTHPTAGSVVTRPLS